MEEILHHPIYPYPMKYSMLGILSRERIPSSAVEIQEIRCKVKEILSRDSSIGISRGAGNCHTEFARTRESPFGLGFRVHGYSWMYGSALPPPCCVVWLGLGLGDQ